MSFSPSKGALVVYKNQPGTIDALGEKLEIRLRDGQSLKVRPKDVLVLHSGPAGTLGDFNDALRGDLREAWELYEKEELLPGPADLCDLIFGHFTPQDAWALWRYLEDGLWFFGDWDQIRIRTEVQRLDIQAQRDKKSRHKQDLADFLARSPKGPFGPDDQRFFAEVEQLALGKSAKSTILRDLKLTETPEVAHQFLLDCGYWDVWVNPHASRNAPSIASWKSQESWVPTEDRLDLTHLKAFAIDNEGSQDPDDALSIENNRLWVHIADPSALIPPGSDLDLGARDRIGTLYLPEGLYPMLPDYCLNQLGLGLQEISPALSFALDLNPDSTLASVKVYKTLVKVTRLTYEAADALLGQDADLDALQKWTGLFEARRRSGGSVTIDIPEVKIRVSIPEKSIDFLPLTAWKSADLVREAMILAGEGAASYAASLNIPFPSIVQEAPDSNPEEVTIPGLAGMWAKRRLMKRRSLRTIPGAHAGLGLSGYSQVTSPLRRYLDLVAHQQLRLHLEGQPTLTESEILERVGAVEAVGTALRQSESQSKRHWTLAWLGLNPQWVGQGVVVKANGKWAQVFVPQLGLEADLPGGGNLELNTELTVKVGKMNLSQLFLQLEKTGSQPF